MAMNVNENKNWTHTRYRYHFIGIGGDGMSGLAKVLWQGGEAVCGSNIEPNPRTAELARLGIPVAIGHDAAHLEGAEAVVFSSAIPPDNVELHAAQKHGLPVWHRLELIARWVNRRPCIGVAGTHGKTTTTAMIATLLRRAGRDPSYLIGAACPGLEGHAHLGRGPHIVLEVDESDGRFLGLTPQVAVLTSIDLDHLNHYRDEQDLLRSFGAYLAQSGKAILCADDPNCRRLLERFPRALSYGILRTADADLVAQDLEQADFHTRFTLRFRDHTLGRVELPLPGEHNVYNTLAALLAGWEAGLDFAEMLPALSGFRLPERRFQVLTRNGVMVVDDYAHLPQQVEVNLQAIRANWARRRDRDRGRGRLIALFQPHRFSRTQYLNGHFARAFQGADLIGVTEIYPAFEPPIPGVDARQVVRSICAQIQGQDPSEFHRTKAPSGSGEREGTRSRKGRGESAPCPSPDVRYLPRPQDVLDFLRRTVRPGDFVIGFGAGDLWKVLHRFVAELEAER